MQKAYSKNMFRSPTTAIYANSDTPVLVFTSFKQIIPTFATTLKISLSRMSYSRNVYMYNVQNVHTFLQFCLLRAHFVMNSWNVFLPWNVS